MTFCHCPPPRHTPAKRCTSGGAPEGICIQSPFFYFRFFFVSCFSTAHVLPPPRLSHPGGGSGDGPRQPPPTVWQLRRQPGRSPTDAEVRAQLLHDLLPGAGEGRHHPVPFLRPAHRPPWPGLSCVSHAWALPLDSTTCSIRGGGYKLTKKVPTAQLHDFINFCNKTGQLGKIQQLA